MKLIASEEPSLHWYFLDVEDKTVLDLGCGMFYSSITTADYFLQQKAKLVVGVDLGPVTDTPYVYHQMNIQSSNQLKDLINEYAPDVIKCDIEGAEKYFNDVDFLGDCKQFSVEYHDAETKDIMMKKLQQWGFTIIDIFQLFNESIDRIGVINAVK
jgi:hypothetical protein